MSFIYYLSFFLYYLCMYLFIYLNYKLPEYVFVYEQLKAIFIYYIFVLMQLLNKC